MHKIGADVQQTGAKKDVLRSVAIEMSQKAEVKQKQIDFNLKLCQRAGGKLAQVNCTEKFLSIGGSHFAAFCRAALACCPTPQQVLKDEDGNIDIAKLKKNPVMKELLEKGWTWQVITWKAEERYPGLAAFLQRALNAGNSVPNDMSEFEVMLCIIEHAALEEDDIDWKKCQDIATHGNPRCSQYKDYLMDFVKNYGGGVGAPIIHELNTFAAKHCGSPLLGEEFWTAMQGLNFGKLTPCPQVRTAIVACNLTAPKIIDGVAKLLTKTDLKSLQTRDNLVKVHNFEQSLNAAIQIVETICLGKSSGHLCKA